MKFKIITASFMLFSTLLSATDQDIDMIIDKENSPLISIIHPFQIGLRQYALDIVDYHYTNVAQYKIHDDHLLTLDQKAHRDCFFDYSFTNKDGLSCFTFKPKITSEFLLNDAQQYEETVTNSLRQNTNSNWIKSPINYCVWQNKHERGHYNFGINACFIKRCYQTLVLCTTPVALSNFKNNIFNYLFAFYRLILTNDPNSFFYPYPIDIKKFLFTKTYLD